MGKTYTRSHKRNARTEKRRRKSAVAGGEWDGFQGRGQRVRKYWWDLPKQSGKVYKTKFQKAKKYDPMSRGKKTTKKIMGMF